MYNKTINLNDSTTKKLDYLILTENLDYDLWLETSKTKSNNKSFHINIVNFHLNWVDQYIILYVLSNKLYFL